MSIVKSALGATAVIGGGSALGVSFAAGSRSAARGLDEGAKKVRDDATDAGLAQMVFAGLGIGGGIFGLSQSSSVLRGAGVGAFALAGVLALGTAFSFGRATAAESRM